MRPYRRPRRPFLLCESRVTQGPLYEYACHEGNHSMVNVLSGARAQDAAAAAAKKGSKR